MVEALFPTSFCMETTTGFFTECSLALRQLQGASNKRIFFFFAPEGGIDRLALQPVAHFQSSPFLHQLSIYAKHQRRSFLTCHIPSSLPVSAVVKWDLRGFHHVNSLRWLGTVVTSHTASHRQAYTPVMSMVEKAVRRTHCTSCNQPADHTNAIMLYAVKCSVYEVGHF